MLHFITPKKALNWKLITVLTVNLDFPAKESGILHQILGFLACFFKNVCAFVLETRLHTHDFCIVLSDQPKQSCWYPCLDANSSNRSSHVSGQSGSCFGKVIQPLNYNCVKPTVSVLGDICCNVICFFSNIG